MRKDWKHLDKWRVQSGHIASRKGDTFGAFFIPFNNYILATDGEADEDVHGSTEWEHVSAYVALQERRVSKTAYRMRMIRQW